jgi:hypothetical protein
VNEVVFRGWHLAYDADATARAYASARPVGPEACGCADCLNFIAARDASYPADLKQLAATVGVAPLTESEIYVMGVSQRFNPTTRLYGGWFHFVGSILKDPGGPADQVYFLAQRHLLPASFGSAPVVQAEFNLQVPWVLAGLPAE